MYVIFGDLCVVSLYLFYFVPFLFSICCHLQSSCGQYLPSGNSGEPGKFMQWLVG